MSIEERVLKDFPITFCKDKPLPMLNGMHFEIYKHYEREFKMKEILIFLRAWAERDEYKHSMVSVRTRHNLQGRAKGFVSKTQREYHKQLLNN